MPQYHLGQRLSYDGALCTIRYIGPLEGTKAEWLGVEWDVPDRCKHDGRYKGEVVFKCLSPSMNAASFIKSTRNADPKRTFLDALRLKYTDKSGEHPLTEGESAKGETPILISGKIAQEIGFDRIRGQQSVLENLKIVVLDGMRICGIRDPEGSRNPSVETYDEVRATCPNIIELDIGWNLLETYQDIADICHPLRKLKVLRAR